MNEEQCDIMKQDMRVVSEIIENNWQANGYYEAIRYEAHIDPRKREWWEENAPHAIVFNPRTVLYHVVNWLGETARTMRFVEKTFEEELVEYGPDSFGFQELPNLSLLIFDGKFFGRYPAELPWLFYDEGDAPWLNQTCATAYIRRWELMRCLWEAKYKELAIDQAVEFATVKMEDLNFDVE